MRLKGKTALITGAGSGFGAEMARRFASEGAIVICADRNAENAQAVASSIGASAHAAACDVSNSDSVKALAGMAAGVTGRIDVLVNNAGISQQPRRIAKLPEAEIDAIFAVNVKALYHAAGHILPIMVAGGGGSVVNIASVTAIRPRPGMTWYNAAKAAVISITQSMAGEFAENRVRVNVIAPGVGRTPMFDAIFKDPKKADEAHDRLVETFPLGRLSKPSDIAGAALYLASDDAEFVTGIVLPVDGGRLIA
jgi:3-oxoacyl-[acyl-carrier protein] reductase